MALTQISTAGVKDDAVTAGKIPANAVGSSELADNAVDTAAIADDAVTAAKLASNAVVNASVDASAAIAGTKISPDFGSQNIATTGTLGSSSLTISTSTDASFFINTTNANGAHLRLQTSGTNKSFIGQASGISGSLGNANDLALRSTEDIVFSTNNNNTPDVKIDSSGRVAIQGSPTRALLEVRASGGNNTMLTAVFGADEGTTAGTLTDNADKGGRVGLQHYDIDEEPFGLFSYGATNGTNALNFGGGTSLMNAATHMGFYTASNSTTTGGTERIRIDSSGRVGIGTSSPAKPLDIYKSGTNQSDMYVRNATVNYKVQTMSDQAQAGTETNHPFYVVSNNQYVARFDGDGIKFGSDTAAANALDDYEEGNWTPTITRSGSGLSISLSQARGRYQKIGNIVWYWFDITVSSVSGGSGTYYITLPFTHATGGSSDNAGHGTVQFRDSNAVNRSRAADSSSGVENAIIFLHYIDSNGNEQPMTMNTGRLAGSTFAFVDAA